jgi:coenzyme F420-reducing hydrogenase alpha subunit
MEIRVEHLTRVEGHGNVVASTVDGRVRQAVFEVVEANRFFEAILRGRDHEEVSHIASRICGICALSHACASLQATEAALGLEVSEQTVLLRRLIMDAETISSHALHVYFLAAPDYLGLQSVLPLIQEDPETVKRAFRVKKAGYDLAEVIVGRHTHPVSMIPGGFTSVPRVRDFEPIRARLVALRDDLALTVEMYQHLDVPAFERPTEYVSLRHPDHYCFYGGDIVSSAGEQVPAARYLEAIDEVVVEHSTAKHARWYGGIYRVGALARVNNNWRQLHAPAQEAMRALGLVPPCHNPFQNNAAQVVELVHCLEDALMLIDTLASRGIELEEDHHVEPRAGRGVGLVEAPRGLLIHDYTYDERGKCEHANCIIPTAQNYANLDEEMAEYLAQIASEPEDAVRRGLEMLVRAYDPCISCSTH